MRRNFTPRDDSPHDGDDPPASLVGMLVAYVILTAGTGVVLGVVGWIGWRTFLGLESLAR